MTTDEIQEAQRPYAGWERETRAFSSNATSPPPRWQDFTDPIDAIGARFQERMREARARQDGKPLSDDDRTALRTLGLTTDADRKILRARSAELVTKYNPDRNGANRRHQQAFKAVHSAHTQSLKERPEKRPV